jgi:hypothetical protein
MRTDGASAEPLEAHGVIERERDKETKTSEFQSQTTPLRRRLPRHAYGQYKYRCTSSSPCRYRSTPSTPRETCELGLNEQKGEKKWMAKQAKHHSVLKQVKRVGPGPMARGMRFLFNSDLARITLTLHRDLDNAHIDTNMPKRQPRRYRRFFLVLPSPKKGGRGGVGGRAAARSSAHQRAPARTRGNEVNTARRPNALLTCRFALF